LKKRLPAPKTEKKAGAVKTEKQQIDALQEQIALLNKTIAAQAEELAALKEGAGLVANKKKPAAAENKDQIKLF
jgi:hypothetical protein